MILFLPINKLSVVFIIILELPDSIEFEYITKEIHALQLITQTKEEYSNG